MMNFNTFYDIAEYGSTAWKGAFSQREIAENAHIYTCDFEWSKENDNIACSIKELAKLLIEDGTEQAKEWLYDIADELGLIDMDYMDYIETDADIISIFMGKTNENNTRRCKYEHSGKRNT